MRRRRETQAMKRLNDAINRRRRWQWVKRTVRALAPRIAWGDMGND